MLKDLNINYNKFERCLKWIGISIRMMFVLYDLYIYIYLNIILCLKTCCALRGGLRSIFHLIFWWKNFETFDFSWFQKNILKFFDRQVRLTDSLSWTWQRSGSKISVENLGRKYTYNKKIIWYLIWTYSRIPAGFHDFSPWFFLTDVFF